MSCLCDMIMTTCPTCCGSEKYSKDCGTCNGSKLLITQGPHTCGVVAPGIVDPPNGTRRAAVSGTGGS
ncbi:uncharacterized protein RAG0_01542 [Rhynchosporium agropyri]|uniref:Uncharacterized protein n=3 Tax=Rhynchosporium TaxID=38037 RepID=A0A1E1M7P8_RHYSE|nr:uncharacterized protein RAG0_01542 [Rhynchosporium agropyri]CZS98407.1 uncharacterized protein RCO7_04204 [Rhynchosporium commune]CZT45119.1 uncharacterized protein RSE6_05402 [Rhynchosporium secalis]